MCRSIKTLFNFEPPATDEEVRAAALQFVRKLSGFTAPSKANRAAFDRAVDEVAASARGLIASLITTADPRDREIEAQRARALGRALRSELALRRPRRLGAALRPCGPTGPQPHRPAAARVSIDKLLEASLHCGLPARHPDSLSWAPPLPFREPTP